MTYYEIYYLLNDIADGTDSARWSAQGPTDWRKSDGRQTAINGRNMLKQSYDQTGSTWNILVQQKTIRERRSHFDKCRVARKRTISNINQHVTASWVYREGKELSRMLKQLCKAPGRHDSLNPFSEWKFWTVFRGRNPQQTDWITMWNVVCLREKDLRSHKWSR